MRILAADLKSFDIAFCIIYCCYVLISFLFIALHSVDSDGLLGALILEIFLNVMLLLI